MDFEEEYEAWLQDHAAHRKGPAKTRIVDGVGHAEKLFLKRVWWPTFGQFDGLHPEYRVNDINGGHRFVDFAYVRPDFRIAIEIDGFGPHLRDVNRYNFSDAARRQNLLVVGGWQVLRFAYDDVKDHAEICVQTILQTLGQFSQRARGWGQTTPVEREVVRMASHSFDPITPNMVAAELHVHPSYARDVLHQLAKSHWLEPASGSMRIRSYQLHRSRRGVIF